MTLSTASTGHVRAELRAVCTAPGRARATVEISVEPGWYVYAPGSPEGKPVALVADTNGGQTIDSVTFPEATDWLLSGQFELQADMATSDRDIAVQLHVQTCNKSVCESPRSLKLGFAITCPSELANLA
jgi:hypothetical protein